MLLGWVLWGCLEGCREVCKVLLGAVCGFVSPGDVFCLLREGKRQHVEQRGQRGLAEPEGPGHSMSVLCAQCIPVSPPCRGFAALPVQRRAEVIKFL